MGFDWFGSVFGFVLCEFCEVCDSVFGFISFLWIFLYGCRIKGKKIGIYDKNMLIIIK